MALIEDDKAQYVLPFLFDLWKRHHVKHGASDNPPPLFIGLNGVQGAGKSVLVDILQATLLAPPYELETLVFSLDDLYLTHQSLVKLAQVHHDNPLLQHRGQPSTHDLPLASAIFKNLKTNQPTKIPRFNKALFSGQGDRVPCSEWIAVNSPGHKRLSVVIFEGWSVAFEALSTEDLASKHSKATEAAKQSTIQEPYTGQLGHVTLANVTTINEALKHYGEITSQFDGLVHIDAEDTQFVFDWRLEQEAGLRARQGSGMHNDQVKQFIAGYYPTYELYTGTLRDGIFRKMSAFKNDWQGRQLRLIVGKDRKVKNVIQI
jgi:D-glycerate 3-kinase